MTPSGTGPGTREAAVREGAGAKRYDVLVAMHAQPTRDRVRGLVKSWVDERDDLSIEEDDDGANALVVRRATRRGAVPALRIEGPRPATPDDLPPALAGACLRPRALVAIGVRLPSPKRNFQLARALGREVAERNEGAAFDPQEDALIFPRGRPRRVPTRPDRETTSKVALEWFLPADRWDAAPETLVRVLRSRCPEALPTRYGLWEPTPHQFDMDDPGAFVAFLRDNPGGDAFWLSSRPSFGGSCFGPVAEVDDAADERLRIGYVGVNFDGRVLEADARWRETIVDLFVAAASGMGAFFAGAQVLPGWVATRNNRLWATSDTLVRGEALLRGQLWQGLPPVPMWLSWYGASYRKLVARHVGEERLPAAAAASRPRGSLLRRLVRRGPEPPTADGVEVRQVGGGLLVRLAQAPTPRERLLTPPLPRGLTYRPQPASVRADGVVVSGARAEDQAAVIPPLRS